MKKQKMPSLVTIGVLTLITIASWIGFNVIRIITNKKVEKVPAEILNPLNPTLDKNTLDKVRQRLYFEREQTVEIISPSPSASPSTVPLPTEAPATVSGEISL